MQRIDKENHDSAKTIDLHLSRAIQIEKNLSVLPIQTKLQVEFFLTNASIDSAFSCFACGKSHVLKIPIFFLWPVLFCTQ